MLNRTATWIFRAFVVTGFALSLSACGHARHHEHEHHEGDVKEHAEECPHGGGACCEHEEPHPCCTHTEGAGAESQPAEGGEGEAAQ